MSTNLHRLIKLGFCIGAAWNFPCHAQEDNALIAPVVQHVRPCSIRLAIPAQWGLSVERSDGHCKISVERPEHDSLCGVYDEGDDRGNGKKTFCDDKKRIVVDVQPGSIKSLTRLPDIRDPLKSPERTADPKWGDFVYEKGTWSIDSSMGNYRGDAADGRGGTRIDSVVDTRETRSGTRKIVYAERPWRKYFQEGAYCCTDSSWEALVDLPGARYAWIEVQWPENEKNVVALLQSLR